jgi:ketol-acid reductoisomerase
MRNILIIVATTSILLFSGCTKGSDAKPSEVAPATTKATMAEAQKAITIAETKYKEIKAMRSIVWQSTKKEIDKAQEAVKKGEYDKAIKHAKEAEYQVNEALAQQQEYSKIWQTAMPQALMK